MKAVIYLDVPDWQIGQDVSIFFPDTMVKHCKCELLKEQEAVEPGKDNDGTPEPYTAWWYVCGNCGLPIDMTDRYCRRCGRSVKWNDK